MRPVKINKERFRKESDKQILKASTKQNGRRKGSNK